MAERWLACSRDISGSNFSKTSLFERKRKQIRFLSFVQEWKKKWKAAFSPRFNSDKVEIEKVEFMRSEFPAFLRFSVLFFGAVYSPISFTLR